MFVNYANLNFKFINEFGFIIGSLNLHFQIFMKKNTNKFNFKLTKEKIHSLNVYLFLGFNLTLVSVLGFIWMKSSVNHIV